MLPGKLSEGDITNGDMRVHYYRTGNGDKPPLVLAHGFTDNGLCWARLVTELKNRFDIVMIDARNHGRSGGGSATLAELASDMAAVITQLHLAPCAVLGHSVGASVAAALAALYPDLVSQLLLEDPPWTLAAYKPASDKRIAAFEAYVTQMHDLTEAEIVAEGERTHPRWHTDEFAPWALAKRQVSADAMAHLELGDWQDSVRKFRAPTLILHAGGERDSIVNVETAALARRLNSKVSDVQIEGGGHNLRREQFTAFVNAVLRFLAPS